MQSDFDFFLRKELGKMCEKQFSKKDKKVGNLRL